MPDERTHIASRREPITTTVDAGGKKFSFTARPIPLWRARNDFANEVVKQYITAMNEWVHAVQADAGDVILEGQAFESVMDYGKLFVFGYGSYDEYTPDKREATLPSPEQMAAFEMLDFDAMVAVLDAALEVNGLERQQYMLDRRKKGEAPEESPKSPSDDAGQKMESSPASG